jgi:hypothetical protein
MKRRLIVSDGQRERELLLVGTIVVGRDPACDVSEDGDSLLSRRHSEFVAGPDGVIVRDLGSRNGTFVNGVRVAESPVHPGDVVHIGHLRLRYVEGDEALAAGRPAAPAPAAATVPRPVEDEDVTRILQGARSSPAVEPRASAPPVHDDERTVVTPRPGAAPAREAAAAGLPAAADEERTVFVTSGSNIRPPVAAAPAPPLPRAPAAAAPEAAGAAASVTAEVFGVAIVAFLAAVAGVWLGRSELFGETTGVGALVKWLGVPLAVALLAAGWASRAIARRIGRPPAADNEEGLRV